MTENFFYFIRHGETDWNRENRVMGQKDIPLNEKGRFQAKQAKLLLKNCNIQTVCYSPLQRAQETALILNELLKCPLQEMPSLMECGWGSFEGKLKGTSQYFQYFEQWVKGSGGGNEEACQTFKERVMEGINSALTYPNPLIVAHSGVYWVLQQILCGDTPLTKTKAGNCTPFFFSKLGENSWTSTPLDLSFEEHNLP